MIDGPKNYAFCANVAARHGGRILDFGCGRGEIVKLLKARGVQAFGCDTFYEGGSYRDVVEPWLISSGAIKEMDGDRIPFQDGFFDVVVNNQVMEHVPQIEPVLEEIRRVLKPGGVLLSLFPHAGIWREGHRGVPFLHWFSK